MSSEVKLVEIRKLRVCPLNVRKRISDLKELKDSIRSVGLLQPIIVRPAGDLFEVVVGQRRFLACKELGWKEIPAVVREMSDKEALELSLTENIQIESLDPLERAEGVKSLLDLYQSEGIPKGKAIEIVAKTVGKHPNTIRDWLRLLRTTEAVKEMIRERKIDVDVGARIASLPEGVQEAAAEVIHEEYLPRRKAMKVIQRVRKKIEEEGLEVLMKLPKEEVKEQVVREAVLELEEYNISVSFPGWLYSKLCDFAQRRKLTVQEVIRRAVKKYISA